MSSRLNPECQAVFLKRCMRKIYISNWGSHRFFAYLVSYSIKQLQYVLFQFISKRYLSRSRSNRHKIYRLLVQKWQSDGIFLCFLPYEQRNTESVPLCFPVNYKYALRLFDLLQAPMIGFNFEMIKSVTENMSGYAELFKRSTGMLFFINNF